MKAINCITVLHICTYLINALTTKNFVYQLKVVNFNDKLFYGYRTNIISWHKHIIILYALILYGWIKNEYCKAGSQFIIIL